MPTQMAAAGDERGAKRACATTTVRHCWSSTLPDDLLLVIYRMVASPRGRARFAAVCRSWRAAAVVAPPATALPWLLLSPCDDGITKQLHCPEDGTIVRVLYPGRRDLLGCHGDGWVATYMMSSLRVINVFSGAEVKLVRNNFPHYVHHTILKVVFSESPTSPDCILAATTEHLYMGPSIWLWRVGCTKNKWTIQPYHGMTFADITFCNTKLYGLRKNARLLVEFQIDLNEDGEPVVIAQRRLTMETIAGHIPVKSQENVTYVFDLHGKPAMAKRAYWSQNKEPFFKVFKLVDINANKPMPCYKHKWMEVTNLGDHALFLGQTFSKAVHVPENTRGAVETNHIYFSHHCRFRRYDDISGRTVLLGISNESGDETYRMEDDGKNDVTGDEVSRIRSVGYLTKGFNNHGCAWVLPPAV